MAGASALLVALGLPPALAQPAGPPVDAGGLARCVAIADPAQRLACYDEAAGRATTPAAPAAPSADPGDQAPPAGAAATPAPRRQLQLTPGLDELPVQRIDASLFEDRWSLGNEGATGRFDLRAHKPTYLLPLRYSDRPNRLPQSPTQAATPVDLRHVEAKFQISFKVRLADWDLSSRLGDESRLAIWGAYTQQSQWQVYNGADSRPFRETNYEPELIVALDPARDLGLGWRWRLAALSLTHQSNGRDDPLSRSWDRVIGWIGIEKGGLGLQLRAWRRLNESRGSDNNPDIGRYMGYGDALFVYQAGDHDFSLLARRNWGSAKGALQAAWTFPLNRRLRGTLQFFEGYGESMIDYNVRQRTLGFGIVLADWL